MPPMPPLCYLLISSAIQWIFLVCSKYAPIVGEKIEKLQFIVQTEVFRKKHFFTLPPPALACVAQGVYT